MQLLIWLGVLVASYVLGAVPLGFLIVKIMTGKDVRKMHSGRTGGANVMRTAGYSAGLATGIGDILKGACAVWLAKAIAADDAWVHALAGIFVILGHNYSIFLAQRIEGKLKLRGGAGGAPSVGAAMGLWAPSILIIVPILVFMLFGVGYASLATLSVGLLEFGIFTVRAIWFQSQWEYILYGLFALAVLLWGLRPNIRRLLRGEERLIGWRARAKAKREGED
jgi:glycerol-3-phosphate acyltransferase PlsY